jgi:thioredoxin-like negative regulator of GroEL
LFVRAFQREEAAHGEIVSAFRARVSPQSREAFDQGVQFFSAGDFVGAEQSFKNALRVDEQSSVALAYLGATYAASGHDAEASGAWQTSLIDGSDFPQIYAWLADTMMRLHQLAEAKTVLEEAVGKWPSDLRFAKPLALAYATFGQGREAIRTLERHLATAQDDQESLALGVEWMYHLHAAGLVAHTRAEDLKLAASWAAKYETAQGPQTALVKEWLQALEANRR